MVPWKCGDEECTKKSFFCLDYCLEVKLNAKQMKFSSFLQLANLAIYIKADFSKQKLTSFHRFPNIGGNISGRRSKAYFPMAGDFFGRAGWGWEMGSPVKHLDSECHHFSERCNFSARTLHKRLGITLKQIFLKFAFEVYTVLQSRKSFILYGA